MRVINEINIKTTDGAWWRLVVNDIYEIRYENDETIADRILAETSVPAGMWIEVDDVDSLGKQMYINTANIIAIEVIRESEE